MEKPKLALDIMATARELGRHPDSVRRMVREGKLRARRDASGKWLVSVASIEAFKRADQRRNKLRAGAAVSTPLESANVAAQVQPTA